MHSVTYRKKLSFGANVLIPAMLLLLVASNLGFLQLPRTATILVSAGVLLMALAALLAPTLRFWFFRGMPADNFLRLDGEGLIHTVYGRERKWRWSELSGLQRRGQWLAVTVPDDDRVGAVARWWGRVSSKRPRLLIRDDYVIGLEDLLAKLDRHRVAAAQAGGQEARGEAPKPGGETTSPAPLVFHQRHSSAEMVGLPAYMAVCLLPFVILGAILFLQESEFSQSTLILLGIFGPVVLLICAVIGFVVLVSRKRANLLSLDREGLRYKRRGISLAWPWRELSTFEIRKTSPQSWLWQGVTARVIAFTALGDGQAPPDGLEKLFKMAGPDSYAILDHYGISLDEIAAKLNEYRERALAGSSRA